MVLLKASRKEEPATGDLQSKTPPKTPFYKMPSFFRSVSKADKLEMKHGEKRPDFFFKVILLGDTYAGKTSLLRSFDLDLEHSGKQVKNLYALHKHIESVQKIIPVGDKSVFVKVQDTCGQEKYRSLTASYYRGAHGCLILFDVTKLSTFENIEYWLHDLKEYTTQPDIATILIGTKCHVSEEEREVKKERAQKYAENARLPYMEVSAEHGINVTEAFEKLADMIIENLSKQPTITNATKTTHLTASEPMKKKPFCAC